MPKTLDGEIYTLYSDTGWQDEIRYSSADCYGLDDPLNRVRLVRLARAMGCLACHEGTDGVRECRVTVCRARELTGVESENTQWVPFDPRRIESLDERVDSLKRRVDWHRRMGSS